MIPKLSFVFFGSPAFAVRILSALVAAGFSPLAVVTNPDRPVGRKQIVTPSAVKKWVMGQATSIKDKIEIFLLENHLFRVC